MRYSFTVLRMRMQRYSHIYILVQDEAKWDEWFGRFEVARVSRDGEAAVGRWTPTRASMQTEYSYNGSCAPFLRSTSTSDHSGGCGVYIPSTFHIYRL